MNMLKVQQIKHYEKSTIFIRQSQDIFNPCLAENSERQQQAICMLHSNLASPMRIEMATTILNGREKKIFRYT